MTAQKGKDLLLKVDTDGAGSFVTVAGLRAHTLAFNAATVDEGLHPRRGFSRGARRRASRFAKWKTERRLTSAPGAATRSRKSLRPSPPKLAKLYGPP
jgi:hypothetical protein